MTCVNCKHRIGFDERYLNVYVYICFIHTDKNDHYIYHFTAALYYVFAYIYIYLCIQTSVYKNLIYIMFLHFIFM